VDLLTRSTNYVEPGRLMMLTASAKLRGGRSNLRTEAFKIHPRHSFQTHLCGVEAASGPETIAECGLETKFSYLIAIPSLGGVFR